MKRLSLIDPLTRSRKDAEFWKGVACGLTLAMALILVAFLRA